MGPDPWTGLDGESDGARGEVSMGLHFEEYQGLRVAYCDEDLPDYRQQLLQLLKSRMYKATWIPASAGATLPLLPFVNPSPFQWKTDDNP